MGWSLHDGVNRGLRPQQGQRDQGACFDESGFVPERRTDLAGTYSAEHAMSRFTHRARRSLPRVWLEQPRRQRRQRDHFGGDRSRFGAAGRVEWRRRDRYRERQEPALSRPRRRPSDHRVAVTSQQMRSNFAARRRGGEDGVQGDPKSHDMDPVEHPANATTIRSVELGVTK